ncbi:hypothetical protein B0T26DRAFT_868837 [Lasiosphaeria miniovina]|uniref:Uncharacterized protein n=1 Tax=Lasiosphaeria miniovina TaxID=1954250 RepID=A0AA40B554_9PEZI|nr:uncharacterized protein B0T26DRAFT_868837 [Lasiosphaeria miniovina]KAK0727568.1 hypothetical protein B0T26DRAFT_868837 [Lasiosphaeria miniovina]
MLAKDDADPRRDGGGGESHSQDETEPARPNPSWMGLALLQAMAAVDVATTSRPRHLEILSTWLLTLPLCIWSAPHLNIPEHGKGGKQLWRKTRWLIVGLVALEIIAFIALLQRSEQKKPCASMVNGSDAETELWSPVAKPSMWRLLVLLSINPPGVEDDPSDRSRSIELERASSHKFAPRGGRAAGDGSHTVHDYNKWSPTESLYQIDYLAETLPT